MQETENYNKGIDYCSFFPDNWYQWANWYTWRKISIKKCCFFHDDNCDTRVFITCLARKNIVGRYIITFVAATACFIRYGKV